MATLKEVARLAGVHPSTISRALRNDPNLRITEETRRRILEAIEAVNYHPNRVARSLRAQRTNVLALMVPDITNPFFAVMLRGVEDAAGAEGFSVIVCNTDERDEKVRAYLQILMGRLIDGMLIATAKRHDPTVMQLCREGYAIVLVNRLCEQAEVPSVGVDESLGTRLAVEHLIALGHRRIAHIAGPDTVSTAHVRRSTFEQVLEEHGLEVRSEWVVAGGFNRRSGYLAMQRLLALPQRPTAILAANDLVALGAMTAAREAGLRIPQELSVVGYNDIPIAAELIPPLTTVRVPMNQMGARAAELLIARITGRALAEQRVVLLPELVVRGTTAPPPQRPGRDGARAGMGVGSRRTGTEVAALRPGGP